ncbi:MAG TPA: T9SS type A sorting domain-containing protein [Bacteroidota bacterium]|nr:T9SS type A sorting domain-containing protein [Bacteroidota bacterium]
MKPSRLICVLTTLILFPINVLAQDTLWIDPSVPGALETTINGDVAPDGSRNNPNRVYALHKDAVYIQNAGIVFTGGGTLSIVGEKGGAFPVVQMQHVVGFTTEYGGNNSAANKIEGSLHLDHVYWLGKGTEGTQYSSIFFCSTVNNQAQSLLVNDCVVELLGFDFVTAQDWNHGATCRITNCYFRAMFTGQQWWVARVFFCKEPTDTLWVENCTFSDPGLAFIQAGALCRFAYINHNTFINGTKYWLFNCFYLSLFITNNLFENNNWVGEDTVNITPQGFDPDSLLFGTINIDTLKSSVLVQPEYRNLDGSVNLALLGPERMRIFASNNIFWTDTLLNAYYTNRNNAWNSVGPYPLSYLNYLGNTTGPWQVKNVPSIWTNRRTQQLFSAFPHNMAMTQNIFTRVNTETPGIADAGIATLMGQWNQSQWGDPKWPLSPDLANSSYVPGDKDANTFPGYTNGVKSENAQSTRVAKVSDFIENYGQAGVPVLSTIDNKPIGSLQWSDGTVSANAYDGVLAAFVTATGYTPPPPPSPPPAPTAMPATNISGNSFRANWSASARSTSYLLDVALDSGFNAMLTNYNGLKVGNVIAADVTGLYGTTTYYYRVRASNDGGTSGLSNSVAVTTSVGVPRVPAAKAASGVTSTSFTANWDSSASATGYILDVAIDSGFVQFLPMYHYVNVGNMLSASVSGLIYNSTYYYHVMATNAIGTSRPSNVIAVTTTNPFPPPPAPVATPATTVASASFTANWDSSAGATGYRLDVAADSAFAAFLPGLQSLNVGPALLYNVTGLEAATPYYYRVRAARDQSVSGPSNVIQVTTSVGPPPPPTPVALAATRVTSTSFTARWDTSAGATEYRIDVARDSLFAVLSVGYNDLLVVGGHVDSLIVVGLNGGYRYSYRIRAGKIGSMSANSNVIGVTTLVSKDTIWIAADSGGILETTINADTDATGQRNNPRRVYALNEGQRYLQRAPIVFHDSYGCLTMCGVPSPYGTTKPMILIDPQPGRPVGDNAVNAVWGSLTLRNVHYQAMQLDGRLANELFVCGTAKGKAQSLVIDNCLFEFCGLDLFDCSDEPGAIGGWSYGAKFSITNSYFRNMFNPAGWNGSRIAQCTHPIDTLRIENCTVVNSGTVFLQRNQLTDFMYVNHNTFINTMKNWVISPYHHSLWITSNIFVNQNWTGEDTNVANSGQDPDKIFESTINVDTNNRTNGEIVSDRYVNPTDTTRFSPSLDLNKLMIFASDNVNFCDPALINGYYLSSKYRLTSLDALPSYLNWAGAGSGPWRIGNLPCAWMNPRTVRLFEAYGPGNGGIVEKRTSTSDPNLATSAIASADVVDSMAAWNQYQWKDPRFPSPPDLVGTSFTCGDYDPNTFPGVVGGIKTDKATVANAGISKFTDLTENFSQHYMISAIDGLPEGALIWDDALNTAFNPVMDWSLVYERYIVSIPIFAASKHESGAPLKFELFQNYPNPFNPTTTIRYTVGGVRGQASGVSNVRLSVYDLLGREVAVVVDERQTPGEHEVRVDGRSLASGMYFYRLTAGNNSAVRKMTIIK